jgi:adhesin/invasin
MTTGITRVIGRLVISAVVSGIGTACNDNNSNTAPPVATAIAVTNSTNGQTGVVGAPLALPISVEVTDQSGAPMTNATVTWTPGAHSGSVASSTSVTDASGITTVAWTLGTTPGADTLQASIGTGATVLITATATVGPASAIQITSGGTQTVTAGAQTAPLVVKVIDQFANPVAGATVMWSVVGGGTLSATSSTTDANGIAQVTLTTDAVPANYVVSASSGTIAPVTFAIASQ